MENLWLNQAQAGSQEAPGARDRGPGFAARAGICYPALPGVEVSPTGPRARDWWVSGQMTKVDDWSDRCVVCHS